MNAKELLHTYLSSIQNAAAAEALFADDGIIELPIINERAQGPVAIQRFLTGLLAKVPDFRFENVRIWIETPDRVFGEYDAQGHVLSTGTLYKQTYAGLLVAEQGRSSWCTKRSTPLRHRAHSAPTKSDGGQSAAQSRLLKRDTAAIRPRGSDENPSRRTRSLSPKRSSRLLLSRSQCSVDHGSINLLCGHPDADVRCTVAKDNAITGFAVAQGANGVTIGEDQIREVQHYDGTGRFCVDQLAQLADVLNVELTADREHDGPVHRALNLQQRHDRR
jgi:hypothetical protein